MALSVGSRPQALPGTLFCGARTFLCIKIIQRLPGQLSGLMISKFHRPTQLKPAFILFFNTSCISFFYSPRLILPSYSPHLYEILDLRPPTTPAALPAHLPQTVTHHQARLQFRHGTDFRQNKPIREFRRRTAHNRLKLLGELSRQHNLAVFPQNCQHIFKKSQQSMWRLIADHCTHFLLYRKQCCLSSPRL